MSTKCLEIFVTYFAAQIGWYKSDGSNLISILGGFCLFLPLREVFDFVFKMSGFQFLND